MDRTYSVIARDALSVSASAAARIVAKMTKRVYFDVLREVRDGVGILASGLSQSDAQRVVGGLSQGGVAAFALDESDLVRFPDPVFLETARLGEDALEVSDLRDAGGKRIGSVNLPYKDIVLLVTAIVRTEVKTTVVARDHIIEDQAVEHPFGVAGVLGNIARQRGCGFAPDDIVPTKRTRHDFHYTSYLDIFAVEPAHHVRLNAGTFNFYQTGMKMQLTSITNLCEFIKNFVARCEQAFVDPSIRHVLDGNPQTNVKFNGAKEYDAYLYWRVQILYHPEG